MNFYDGDVVREDGKTYVSFSGIKLLTDSEIIGDRKKVKVAVRLKILFLTVTAGNSGLLHSFLQDLLKS